MSHFTTKRCTLIVACLLVISAAIADDTPETAKPEAAAPIAAVHMPEEQRELIGELVIVAGPTPEQQDITGSYEKVTPGLYGGISEGSRLGTLSKEIGGVNVSFPVPILTLPGAIAGGISGKAKRDIQEFRDALTEDLAESANQTLSNDGLALDIYRELQRGVIEIDPHLFAATTPIDESADAVLYAGVTAVSLDVQGTEAILTTTAEATLRRVNDGSDLYKNTYSYQDRDSLSNWTENNHALWRIYADFSRHFLGREIVADIFDRIEVRHQLQPRKSATLKLSRKDPWQASSKTATPTLAWDSALDLKSESRSDIAAMTDDDIVYDVEVFDNQRPVYTARQVRGNSHTLTAPIETCNNYRWSVRPSYRVGENHRNGHWMRRPQSSATPDTLIGRKASAAPAYTQDFATLEIAC